jgi:hypothetical protein
MNKILINADAAAWLILDLEPLWSTWPLGSATHFAIFLYQYSLDDADRMTRAAMNEQT